MKIKNYKNFNSINENENKLMDWYECFNMYVKNQKIIEQTNFELHVGISAIGVLLENGYKYISYGGGCSGEDCNTTYIVSPDNEIISKSEW